MFSELLIAFGGSALLLGAVAWLTRSIVLQYLSKDLEQYKQRLGHQSALELERLRHDLHIVAAEHEKVVGLLQEKRASVIAELYARLVDFLGAAESFAAIVEYGGEPTKPEKAKILGEKAWEFQSYFLKHRIYFSESICEKMDNLFKQILTTTTKFRFWLKASEEREGHARKMDEAWDAAWDTIKEKVPPLRRDIEHEFRTLLGVVEKK